MTWAHTVPYVEFSFTNKATVWLDLGLGGHVSWGACALPGYGIWGSPRGLVGSSTFLGATPLPLTPLDAWTWTCPSTHLHLPDDLLVREITPPSLPSPGALVPGSEAPSSAFPLMGAGALVRTKFWQKEPNSGTSLVVQ